MTARWDDLPKQVQDDITRAAISNLSTRIDRLQPLLGESISEQEQAELTLSLDRLVRAYEAAESLR